MALSKKVNKKVAAPSCAVRCGLGLLTLLLLLSSALNSSIVMASIIPEAPEVKASSYLLLDVASGQVLVEKLADEPLPPASLTKLMTSYVLAYELAQGSIKNTDLVSISENAWAKKFPGSSLMWIEVGTRVSVSDLHRGIVIASGNDASVAVAEHLAGSESAFADVMNKHAETLGMTNSHFMNSHGLPHSEHYTTARDLATLATELVTNYPNEYALYKEREFTYNNITQANRNKLLWRDSSVDGLKTGHTQAAGYCMVTSAKREGMRLVSVVLGASSVEARTQESQKLLSYGFRYFETRQIYSAQETVQEVKVWEGESDVLRLGVAEDIYLTIPKGKHSDLNIINDVQGDLIAPIEQGASYGTMRVMLGEETLISAPLIAMHSIEQAGLFSRLLDNVNRRVQSLLGGGDSDNE